MNDNKKLGRFVKAQESAYANALAEIKNGHKRSHWMWFIFPQLKALGRSETAKYYGIADLVEADEYLKHPQLGMRLVEISREVLKHRSASAHDLFGSPDDLKLRSSMTLFAQLGRDSVFESVLNKFFDGVPDAKTLDILNKHDDTF